MSEAVSSVSNREVMEAVQALQTKVENKTLTKEVEEKINTVLNAQESFNQKLVAEQKARESVEAEYKELREEIEGMGMKPAEVKTRLTQLEEMLSRASGKQGAGEDWRDSAEVKSILKWMAGGTKGSSVHISAETKDPNVQVTFSDPHGGYLTLPELDREMVKKMVEVNGLVGAVRTYVTNRNPLRIVGRTLQTNDQSREVGLLGSSKSSERLAEGEAGNDELIKFDIIQISDHRIQCTIPFTREMLEEPEFGFEALAAEEVAEEFSRQVGWEIILGRGDGFQEATGLYVSSDIGTVDTATSTTFVAADIFTLIAQLKQGYLPNANFVMSRQTLAEVRKFVATTGNFLWAPGLDGDRQNQLAGYPYLLAQETPQVTNAASVTAGTKILGFGDLRRTYTMKRKPGMNMIRDEVTRKREMIIEVTWGMAFGGDIHNSEAFKILTAKS